MYIAWINASSTLQNAQKRDAVAIKERTWGKEKTEKLFGGHRYSKVREHSLVDSNTDSNLTAVFLVLSVLCFLSHSSVIETLLLTMRR